MHRTHDKQPHELMTQEIDYHTLATPHVAIYNRLQRSTAAPAVVVPVKDFALPMQRVRLPAMKCRACLG